MAASESDRDPLEEDVRVSSLDERLITAQNRERIKAGHRNKGPDESQRLGARVLSYLSGGVAAGFLLGWLFDTWLGTTPLFLLLFFFLGTGVAFRKIYMISSQPVKDIGTALADDDDLRSGVRLVAEPGKIDPMHQFEVQPIFDGFTLFGQQISFTNSALWMFIVLGLLYVFMMGGMKRELVPGRWQVMVEGVVGFVDNIIATSIGPNGKKYTPWVFTLFMFILFSNLLGMMPFGIIPGIHPFTVTSQFTVTGLLAAISFSIVLIVGFWKHGFKFFSLFIPHGTPLPMIPLIFMVELLSFLVRPFSLALRLFVAMIAGHILIKVFANFVIQAIDAGGASWGIALLSIVFIAFVSALELLVCAIQAYVFALLTSLYINDAENLH